MRADVTAPETPGSMDTTDRKKPRVPLLVRLIIGISVGIVLGLIAQSNDIEWPVRTLATFSAIFGSFLSFAIPLIVFGFITPGIGSLSQGAGRLLGINVGLAYVSTVLAGALAVTCALLLYPILLAGKSLSTAANPEDALLAPYLEFQVDPPLAVTTALVLAFVIGLGITALPNKRLLHLAEDFRDIIEMLLNRVIIPLLPIHIAGVFANMTYGGDVATILKVFAVVFLMVIVLHWVWLLVQYSVAGAVGKTNPFAMLKDMMPAYFTAIGTQSSAATIPVTLQSAKKAGVRSQIADFAIPLNANIHLSGSMITITACAVAVLTMVEHRDPSFTEMIPLILVLGVMMVAAPGAPGGAVMTALGALQSVLGFNEAMLALMIALYLAQDSFGTATNVTGDGAIAKIVDAFAGRKGDAAAEDADANRSEAAAEA